MEIKYTLITGASSGMGLEYAKLLASKGQNILVVSNKEEENRAVANMLENEYGVKALPYYVDLSLPESAEQLFEWTQKNEIYVDILVNNAGMLVFNHLCNTPKAKARLIVGVHCMAPTNLCRLFGGQMKQRAEEIIKSGRKPQKGECGRILIMSSLSAYCPYPTISTYSASKAYLKNLGTALWHEMREYGITVTTVCPSAVDTPLIPLKEPLRTLARRLGVMISPQSMVKSAVKAMYRGRRILIPTLLAKIAAAICMILPQHLAWNLFRIPALKRVLDEV